MNTEVLRPTEPGPSLIDLLPKMKVGKLRLCQFVSTIQVIHDISEFRSVVVSEFPKPYRSQSPQWWQKRIAEEISNYVTSYNR